ncbi:MAG: hypothetical protein H8E24_04400 [Verrucomicrobia bacterium]|nr:hypothetical protein [Verrucomicrobiota bacterium]
MDALPDELAPSLVDHLITQLRTYSVGMRIDGSMRSEFPDLVDEQDASARAQLAQNEASLDPGIRAKFPRPLVDANTSMNAAFARFWANLLGEPRYAVPFDALGYSDVAADLCDSLGKVPDSPERDRELISAWADRLHLNQYFHFQQHSLDD